MIEILTSILIVCGVLVLSQLSPGPDVLYVFRTALAQGFRSGLAVAFGINLGFLLQSIFVCTIGSWGIEQGWGKWMMPLAGCWLLYLAWKILPNHLRSQEITLSQDTSACEAPLTLIGKGFLCNILNPKCMLFILGITSEALHSHACIRWYVPAMIAALFVASLAGWALWSALLQWAPLRLFYTHHVRIIDLIFSLLLATFALMLLLTPLL